LKQHIAPVAQLLRYSVQPSTLSGANAHDVSDVLLALDSLEQLVVQLLVLLSVRQKQQPLN
jgi:hypothetical protein